MLKVHNFGAGPCILPPSVLKAAADAVLNWNGSGLSILEISHRSREFESVMLKADLLVRELLGVPNHYSVLFLQGGASTQFSMIAQNFLKRNTRASYLDTGYFAQKAIKEARLFGDVEIVDSSRDRSYNYIPKNYEVAHDSAYLHITSNNTIEGTQISAFPKTGKALICDMSSDIFSRVIRVEDFDLIYAGAQKNIGPAGMTLVIAKNSFLDSANSPLPAMSDYRTLRDNNSRYNTPPVFAIYVAMLNLAWVKSKGGVAAIEQMNKEKAALLYYEIDRNALFQGMANTEDRSIMNVTFQARDLQTEHAFLTLCSERGMIGVTGYRTVGGFRISLYNALPLDSVKALVDLMREFEKKTLRVVPLTRQAIA